VITQAKERFAILNPRPSRAKQQQQQPATSSPPRRPQPEQLPIIDYEQRLREKIQADVSDLDRWTLDDLGRVFIGDNQRTTWKNLAASLHSAATRFENRVADTRKKKGPRK
jgi:hypothetical protein